MLLKPRMWQAFTSRHSFAVNCLFDLKIWNQETSKLCRYWCFFFLRCYFYVGQLATKPLQLYPCSLEVLVLSFSPCLPSLCVISILTCCSNVCLSLLSLTLTHKLLCLLFPTKLNRRKANTYSASLFTYILKCIFSECANCICFILFLAGIQTWCHIIRWAHTGIIPLCNLLNIYWIKKCSKLMFRILMYSKFKGHTNPFAQRALFEESIRI